MCVCGGGGGEEGGQVISLSLKLEKPMYTMKQIACFGLFLTPMAYEIFPPNLYHSLIN